MTVSRRTFLTSAGVVVIAPLAVSMLAGCTPTSPPGTAFSRVRPGDEGWPSASMWDELEASLTGTLIAVTSPLKEAATADSATVAELFHNMKNPYFIGDTPGLTQTVGQADAWTTEPSVYAVAAESAEDVAAAVTFANEHNPRIAIKGGGHSYQGTSNSADSLLIWTRRLTDLEVHDAFVPAGCQDIADPRAAVSLGAGRLWGHTYNEVMTGHGRYVQGGGCSNVGVAGLIQSGGFGSFSKKYGMAAGSLLEAEVITADGKIRVVNECQDPELFWGLKGGGGGSLGAVTRITLRTHELPDFFGFVEGSVKAETDAAFQSLIAKTVDFYADNLFNEHWGEHFSAGPDRVVGFSMTCQGLDEATVRGLWEPLFDEFRNTPGLTVQDEPAILMVPGGHFWDPNYGPRAATMMHDDRPGAPADNFYEKGNVTEAGWLLHGYQSAWIPADLLNPENRATFSEGFYLAAQNFSVEMHTNKGLAGGAEDALERSRNTAMNPAVFDAFALALVCEGSDPSYPGVAGHEPDMETARRDAAAIDAAMAELYKLVPKEEAGAYVSESNYFDNYWQNSYWGSNYERLESVKQEYDPDGLFFVHNGVGSEKWSSDGFTRI